MRKNVSLARGVAWLVGAGTIAVSGQAGAASCPADSNSVYLSGSSAFAPVLAATQKALIAIGSPVQIVYQKPGSCEGLKYLLGEAGGNPTQDTDSAFYFPGGTSTGCTPPGADAGKLQTTIDIGISDVYAPTCQASFDPSLNSVGTTLGANVVVKTMDFLGPIQAMTIAVPQSSSANTISAEAAYMVFGFDADTAQPVIAPWSMPQTIFTRYYDSGTLNMIATAIGLKAQFWAHATVQAGADGGIPVQQAGSSWDMYTSMQSALQAAGATNPDPTIGILGAANIYAANTPVGDAGVAVPLKPLAFQATGQSCAFYPDSSSNSADKINVRQGRYDIWGPEHLVVQVDSNNLPVGQNNNTAAVQALINALTATMNGPASASGDAGADGGTGLTETEVGTIIDAISAKTGSGGSIPACAMEVSRTAEVGPLSSYQSPYPCICRYEAATGATNHSCTACTADADCSDAGASLTHCRYGFCEAN
jgi:hypothetical protein